MSHPCVVTLDRNSKPRALFAGDRLLEARLPAGARCIYPKPPLAALPDLETAIRRALFAPDDSIPLPERLKPGMKLTIAVDDVSTPLPAMKRPDARQSVLGVLLPLLEDHGVRDVEIIVAIGLRRRLKLSEIENAVGAKVRETFFPGRLYNHDPEDPQGLIEVGKTEHGEVVEVHRRVAESDLLICISVYAEGVPRSDASTLLGLSSYRTWRPLIDPKVLGEGHDCASPESSRAFAIAERIERVMGKRLEVFAIGVTLDNRMFDSDLGFLTKNEDELTPRERTLKSAVLSTSGKLPGSLRQAIVDRVPAPYGITGVFAGEIESVRRRSRARLDEQYCVPIAGQVDVLVSGIPYLGPYNVHAFMNPLLVKQMAEGVVFNGYRTAPLLKRGGTLIITHPCTDKFDHEQHAAHRVLVHRLLAETTEASELHARYQEKLAADPALIEMFRRGHAYHPAHPFFAYYSAEAARRYLGKVIVVGADNEYIPRRLGYETAVTMEEALYRARGDSSRHLEIACLGLPSLVVPEVTPLESAPLSEGRGS